MPPIADEHWKRLEDAGLYLYPAYEEYRTLGFGRWMGKPNAVPGNFVPDYVPMIFAGGKITLDAPPLILFPRGHEFIVMQMEHCPTMGPGDFTNVFDNPKAAVDDILDFYFGSPVRMNAITEACKRRKRRLEEFDKRKQLDEHDVDR